MDPALKSMELFLKCAKSKGIFLTFVLSRHPRGRRRGKEADGELGDVCKEQDRGFQGRGAAQSALRTSISVPSPFKFFKGSKQQEGRWSSLYRVISSVSGKDQSSGSCSSEGGGEEKENGKRRKKTPRTNFRGLT